MNFLPMKHDLHCLVQRVAEIRCKIKITSILQLIAEDDSHTKDYCWDHFNLGEEDSYQTMIQKRLQRTVPTRLSRPP